MFKQRNNQLRLNNHETLLNNGEHSDVKRFSKIIRKFKVPSEVYTGLT